MITVKSNDKISVDDFPNLSPFDVIKIQTNHTLDLHKHEEMEILYSFLSNIEYKHKTSENPHIIHYVPIRKDLNRLKIL